MSEPPCLLIVEDDPGFQRQLRSACDGYRIAVADDRESALAAVRADAPAVVVLEVAFGAREFDIGEWVSAGDALGEGVAERAAEGDADDVLQVGGCHLDGLTSGGLDVLVDVEDVGCGAVA